MSRDTDADKRTDINVGTKRPKMNRAEVKRYIPRGCVRRRRLQLKSVMLNDLAKNEKGE